MIKLSSKLVRLSATEHAYLEGGTFLSAFLVQSVKSAEYEDNETYSLRVPIGAAEEFRSAFTNRLAEVGFDNEYQLTKEGRMLEELIGRFFFND